MYQMEIKENALFIQGLFGKYEIKDIKGGFDVSVVRNECASELDENGEEYLIDAGQEWGVTVHNLVELGNFLDQCEMERLWNYIPGPVFRMKPDFENGTLFLKGVAKSFIIGADAKGLYADDAQGTKSHRYVKDIFSAMHMIAKEDPWWSRPATETLELLRTSRSYASVTDGGRLKIIFKDRTCRIGQKTDGPLWASVSTGQERHLYYRDSWKEILGLLIQGTM